MHSLLKSLEKCIRILVFCAISLLILAVVVQVFARTFLDVPPSWTEEASRLALFYVVGFGIGASVLTGDLVNVDLALMVMPKGVRRFCEAVASLLVGLFGAVLIPSAWDFTLSGQMQTSATLGIRMDIMFFPTLPMMVLLAVYGMLKFIRLLTAPAETSSVKPAKSH